MQRHEKRHTHTHTLSFFSLVLEAFLHVCLQRGSSALHRHWNNTQLAHLLVLIIHKSRFLFSHLCFRMHFGLHTLFYLLVLYFVRRHWCVTSVGPQGASMPRREEQILWYIFILKQKNLRLGEDQSSFKSLLYFFKFLLFIVFLVRFYGSRF